jgi:hypothetical protein
MFAAKGSYGAFGITDEEDFRRFYAKGDYAKQKGFAGFVNAIKDYKEYNSKGATRARAKKSYIENRKSSSEAKRKKIKTTQQKKKEAQDARKKQASVKARSGAKGYV